MTASSESARFIAEFRDDLNRQYETSLQHWRLTLNGDALQVASQCRRLAAVLTQLLNGEQLNAVAKRTLEDNLSFYSDEMERLLDLPNNRPGSAPGEFLRDILIYHRRFVASVRALEREAK